MDNDSQLEVPRSFVALFIEPGARRPNEPWDIIEERYRFCEALAAMLVATAKIKVWQLQVTEDDVLDRIYRGLQGGEAGVNPAEARWVITRLAELLEWEPLSLGDESV